MKKVFLLLLATGLASGAFSNPQAGMPVMLVQPNGGELWVKGCPSSIQWISVATTAAPFRIELFRDNQFYMVICHQTPPALSSFTWVPPANLIPGTNFKVKISSIGSPAITDVSDSSFTISGGFINVSSPNGGENLIKGMTWPIQWDDNLCKPVRIELWKGGAFHSIVAPAAPSTGQFSWTVPNVNTIVPGNDYRIRISEAGNSPAATVVADFSDSVFTILPAPAPVPVTLATPNGGESWIMGCPAQITWNTTSALNVPVRLELFRNGLPMMIIHPQVAPGVTSFTWIPPHNIPPGNQYQVRVSTLTSPPQWDMSDSVFTILKGNITVISPNGGENWMKGTSHTILWDDNLCDKVRIELWKGNQFNTVIAHSVPSTGSYLWNIPNVNSLLPGNDYRVKILSVANSTASTGIVFDFSDNHFTISQGTVPGNLTLVAPNGGETWIRGCPQIIQWISPAGYTGMLRIELLKNDQVYLLIHPQVPAMPGNFTWIPAWNIPAGDNFKVRIVLSTGAVTLSDASDQPFSILQGTITVVSPNGGESWAKGSVHPVLWTDNICDNVRIELWKSNQFHSLIAPSVPSTGAFQWTIPLSNTLLPASDYRIRVIAQAPMISVNAMVSDFSDNYFTIAPVDGKTSDPNPDPVIRSYPNPCSDRLFVEFSYPLHELVTITVFDRMGVCAGLKRFDGIRAGEPVSLKVDDLPNGTYLYTIEAGGNLISRGRFLVYR